MKLVAIKMHSVFSFSIVVIFGLAIWNSGAVSADTDDTESAMEQQQVVPDVLDAVPPKPVLVAYKDGDVNNGNVFTVAQVKEAPRVSWEADPDKFYTLLKVDPDAPSRKDPKFREWQHWAVVNIPGGDVSKGETLTAYRGAGPPKGTGLHRYVFIVYVQPDRKMHFDEPRQDVNSGSKRAKFSARNFAKKHHLGDPVAANFYQCQNDEQ